MLVLCSLGTVGQAQSTGFESSTKGMKPVPASERCVGIAYGLWMDRELWNYGAWGTPLLGQYDSRDRRIIRQHAEWLADAKVDFIWLDWSNNITYNPYRYWDGGKQDLIEDATAILFDEYSKLLKRPKISIFIGVTGAPEAIYDGRLQQKADQVYEMYVSNPKYRDLMQYYLGKPLLVVYVNTPTPWPNGTPNWDDSRFTVRWMTGYVTEQPTLRTDELVSKYGYWSWEDRGAQTFPVYNGYPETMVICAATRQQWEKGQPGYIAPKGRRNGKTFEEQWERACNIGTKFAMIVSWNEWTTGEQPSAEISKDTEPSKEFGDKYLQIMKKKIAEFKGLNSKNR